MNRPKCRGPWRSEAKHCDRTNRRLVWQCESTGKMHLTPQTCDKSDCYHCHPRVARKRGKRVYSSIGGVPMWAMVFTFPQELRMLGAVQLVELRKELARLVRAWTVSRWGADVGVIVNFHPCGDQCESVIPGTNRRRCPRRQPKGEPLGRTGRCAYCGARPRWKPHFDVLVPTRGLTGAPGGPQTVKRLPYHVEGHDLAELKLAWSDLVGQVAAELERKHGPILASRTKTLLTAGQGVVHLMFRLKKVHKLHRARYSMRNFPAWSSSLPGALVRYQRFGLAAGNPAFGARVNGRKLTDAELTQYKAAVATWREAVKGELPEAQSHLCHCCTDRQPCVMVDSVHRGASYYRLAYDHLTLYVNDLADPDP